MAKQNKGRKFFAASATAALVASAIVPVASAAQVNDYNKISGYAKEAVQSLVDAGVIQGDTNGNFNPLNTVTRAQAAEIFTKALELEADGDVNFSDVKKGAWYYNSIAAVVANGIFEGVSANEFAPNKSLTRSEAAKVLVDAFGLEGSESLSQFADASQVKPWAKTALETAVANGIFTGSEENGKLNLKPNAAITRQDFAVVFARTLDLVDTETPVDAAIKAINNTTVEVTFDEEVATENLNASDFKIDGLEVKNAAVKQTNKKVVVLTTAAQTAGTEYVLTLKGEELGKFKGIAAVIPTKVDIVEKSVQGKLGQQVTVKAQVTVADGQSKENIPVTFNVPGNNNDAVNPTLTGEALTNADGVATYTYTRYAAKDDTVTAYATGDRSKFSIGYVFWGVEQILTVQEVTEGATINNGANKTYKVTFKNRDTGKVEANKTFNVSVLENINVTADKQQNVTINGEKVVQYSNNSVAPVAAQITTDSKGEATFTVSGTNAEVTPVVYSLNTTAGENAKTYQPSTLQATASKVKFAAVQADYTIELTRDGKEVAATGQTNGRSYKVLVKDKSGNVAKNETVNVAFNEDLDRVISTNTDAKFIDADNDVYFTGNKAKQISVKTNDKGEATFVIGSEKLNDYATPIAWIDINSADAKQGSLDEGEPKAVAAISHFQAPYLDGAEIKAYKTTGGKAVTKFVGNEPAEFKAELVNQSGKVFTGGYTVGKVTYTVFNTGAEDVKVGSTVISPNRSETFTTNGASLLVTSAEGKTTSVKVVATGTAYKDGKDFAFTAKESTATFTASTDVADLYTGAVASYNSADKTIKFVGKDSVKYAGGTGLTYKYFGGNGAQLADADAFITELKKGAAVVTYNKNADGVVTFSFVSIDTNAPAPQDTNVPAGPTVTGVLTLTSSSTSTSLVDVSALENLAISLADADLNVNKTGIDTATVALSDGTNPALTLTLVETGVNTGVFATTVQSGTLNTFKAGTLTATYADAKNTAGNAETVKKSITLKKAAGVLSAVTVNTPYVPLSSATSATYTSNDITSTLGTTAEIQLDVDSSGTVKTISLAGLSTAQQVADAINAAFPGVATVSGTKVVLTSTTDSATSEIKISAVTDAPFVVVTTNGKNAVTVEGKAKFDFTVTTSPVVGEKIKIGTETFTVVTGAPANAFEVQYDASATTFASNLKTAITTDSKVYTAVNTGAVVTLEQKTASAGAAPTVTVE